MALVGNSILFSGYVNFPQWVLIGLAVLSFILLFVQASTERTPAYGFLVALLLFLNWAIGQWIYHTWEEQSWFLEPVIITRVMGLMGLGLVLLISFAYHRYFFSYKQSKGRNREKSKTGVLAPYQEAWQKFVSQFAKPMADDGESDAVYITLGTMVEVDDD